MLYNFLLEFVDILSFLNVFKYITFRTGLAVFTSLILVLIIGGPFIRMVSKKKIVNPIREDGPCRSHCKKNRYTYDGWIELY
jgi:phospho-N-acetylmuramoyl-pentapeptide-transferase